VPAGAAVAWYFRAEFLAPRFRTGAVRHLGRTRAFFIRLCLLLSLLGQRGIYLGGCAAQSPVEFHRE
jgi:hypothetical protein